VRQSELSIGILRSELVALAAQFGSRREGNNFSSLIVII
jgi:hypothetical protein